MGKAARNRQIRKEATEIAISIGRLDAAKNIARAYRRGVIAARRYKHPSTPKGPRVWRELHERVPLDTDKPDGVARRRFRDRLLDR
jgi:hypothetical protein